MRSRALRISAVFAAAFGLGVWLSSAAHALSVPIDSACDVAASCCRANRTSRTNRPTEIRETQSQSVCLLCQLAATPLVTASVEQPTFTIESALPLHPSFIVKTEPAIVYYTPPGRAPPLSIS